MHAPSSRTRKDALGFTLIEIMIVVAIVAILAAIAFPAYQNQVQKTRRADCAAALQQAAGSLERYYTTQTPPSYTNADAAGVIPAKCPIDGAQQFYTINFATNGAGSTYTLTAAPQGSQASDACGSLTLNQLGVKGVGGSEPWEECWR